MSKIMHISPLVIPQGITTVLIPVDMPLCFRTKSGVCPSRALITNIVNDVTCPACAFMTKPRQYRWLHRIFLARINRLAIRTGATMTTSTQTQPKTSTIKFTCIRREVAASSDYVGQCFWKLVGLTVIPRSKLCTSKLCTVDRCLSSKCTRLSVKVHW